MIRSSLLPAAFLLARSLFAQPNAADSSAPALQIVNTLGRATTSLNGKWQTIVDPFEVGYFSYRMRPDPNGFFRNQKPIRSTDRVEYDFDRSPLLEVPGDWNSQRADLLFYEGTVWYRKNFEYALPATAASSCNSGAQTMRRAFGSTASSSESTRAGSLHSLSRSPATCAPAAMI